MIDPRHLSTTTMLSSPVHLLTLGDFRLIEPGAPPLPDSRTGSLLPQGKALALVTYLHCAWRRSATREHLIDLLWREGSTDSGRSALRQTLYRIRSVLGQEAVVTAGDSLTLALPLASDRDDFLAAIRAGRLIEAVHRYTGEFLSGFASPGAAGFEDWAALEREQLRVALISAADGAVHDALEQGDFRSARVVAHQARQLAPNSLTARRLLITALHRAGERAAALLEADALEAWLQAEAVPLDREFDALLREVRRARPATHPVAPAQLLPELVGRDGDFGLLLNAWRRASTGRGQVATVRGGAGLGKSRLLAELGRRLASLRVRTVRVRARSGERDLSGALAAHLATALAALPGAIGVSPRTAATLVELAPALSNTYPGATPTAPPTDDVQRVRVMAVAELLKAVAEETPLALLVDDLHWADHASSQMLTAIAETVLELPVLLVVATRPASDSWRAPKGGSTIELRALTRPEVDSLVASLASVDPALLATLGGVVAESSGGVPLLVVSALELAVNRGLLRIAGERWECEDPDALGHLLAAGGALELLLRDLPEEGLRILVGLAWAGTAVSGRHLRNAAGPAVDADLLQRMEERGLIIRAGVSWEAGHDRLAEAALLVAPARLQRETAVALAASLRADTPVGAPDLQLAGRLLQRGRHPAVVETFREWLSIAGNRRHWRHPEIAARVFLGPEASTGAVDHLASTLPLLHRLIRGRPALAAGLALAVLTGGVAGSLSALGNWDEPAAVTLNLSVPPSSDGYLFPPMNVDLPDGTVVSVPLPLRATALDANGIPTRNAPPHASVRLVGDSGVRLLGTLSQPIRRGHAEFPDLAVAGIGRFRVEVEAGTLPLARTTPFIAVTASSPEKVESVTLLGGRINGQPVDSTRRSIRVRPGAPLDGTLELRSVTAMRSAARLVGAVALWGDRTTNFMALSAAPPHGELQFEARLAAPGSGWSFSAPTTPGRYWLVLLVDAESGIRFSASRTNWALGEPRWFDRDDIADLPESALAELATTGRVRWPRLRHHPEFPDGLRRAEDEWIVGTTIEVVVEP